jgi:hypothetical protein
LANLEGGAGEDAALTSPAMVAVGGVVYGCGGGGDGVAPLVFVGNEKMVRAVSRGFLCKGAVALYRVVLVVVVAVSRSKS